MWLLVLVLLHPTTGHFDTTVLKGFPTLAQCQVAKESVGYWMAEAYPNDQTFRIECQMRESAGRRWRA